MSPLRTRWSRWATASLLLLGLGARHWPATVDDVYISLAYAHAWAAGALQWSTGERVEGYSNFLHVALLTLGLKAGADGAVLAQLLALAGGVGILAVLGALLPPTRAGTVVLLSVAAWSALAWWSTVGMETTGFALLFAAGWALTLRSAGSWGYGVALVALGALERPEGSVWLVAALVARARFGLRGGAGAGAGVGAATGAPGARRADAVAIAAVFGVAAWHAGRIAWFGAALPTPILVKLATVTGSAGGLAQAAGDGLVAAGWLVGIVAIAGVRGRDLPWVLAPLVGQACVLTRADGDWMGMSRLMLPGIVATAAAWLAVGRPRALGTRATAALAAAGLAGAVLSPGGEQRLAPRLRAPPSLAPWWELTRGLDTPVDTDVAFVVTQVPAGQRALAVDAGMLGNVPALRLFDLHGLNWRACAEALAAGRHEDFLAETVNGVDPPEFVRFAYWGGTPPREDLEARLPARYHLRAELRYPPDSFVRWYALHDARPDAETVAMRWRSLAERYPSQPFLVRSYARLLATGEDGTPAGVVPAPVVHLDPTGFAPQEGHPWQDGRGVALYWNATVTSRALAPGEAGRLHLDADAPGAEGATARVRWSGACGEATETVAVFGPTELPARPPCAGPATVEVSFTNDTAAPGDRNLYVAWSAAQ